jgi:DNA-binding response OmpR family regulator
MKVLLVDDDVAYSTALAQALGKCGHEVVVAHTAADALRCGPRDLALIDLGLPDRDGIELCADLRRHGDLGVIVLSARTAEVDRVAALRAGADDYLCKPFVFGELVARADAVLRRRRPGPAGERTVGAVRLDLDRHEVWAGDLQIRLSRKEFQVLHLLSDFPNAVVSRERLAAEVWHSDLNTVAHTMDVHMAGLRGKLRGHAVIRMVRGVGYRLDMWDPMTSRSTG